MDNKFDLAHPSLRLIPAISALLFVSTYLAAQPRELGTVTFLSEDPSCVVGSNDCWNIEVSCPGLDTISALLKIRYAAAAEKGVILFTEGGPGTEFYGKKSQHAESALISLQENGFTTVELAWDSAAWWIDSTNTEGYVAVACRPATAAQWVHDTLVLNTPGVAFCASGNSGGALQVSYMLSHYGLANIVDAAVHSGGPPLGRIDLGCLQKPGFERLWFDSVTAGNIDDVFGFSEQGGGPCVLHDLSFRSVFADASLAFGDNDYHYPTTYVSFIFGDEDETGIFAHAGTYFQRLIAEASPFVSRRVLAGVSHQVHASEIGADTIRDELLAQCLEH